MPNAATPVVATAAHQLHAPRGNIYDRFGRPLAVDIPFYVVTFNSTQTISNEALLELALLFEQNGDNYINDFPMTATWPYEFDTGGQTAEIRQRREYRWKDDMAIPYPETATATESFLYLRSWFGICESLCNTDIRRILNLRTMIFYMRFRPQVFVIATDVSPATIAAISERSYFFNGVGVELRTFRYYPLGRYFSHMLGYVGGDPAVGQTGLERSMEQHLGGTPPNTGHSIFLTIDASMQMQTYHILKEYLTEIAIRHLQNGSATYRQVFTNIIQAGWLPVQCIMEAESESGLYAMRQYVLVRFPTATSHWQDREQIVSILTAGINYGRITPAIMFSAMLYLSILTDENNFAERVAAGQETAVALLVEKLRMGEITPQMANIDPSTGSVVVVCIKTGGVLAAVSYPSYDNNRLANRMDADYFFRINSLCPTHPMVNRPFREARAPGSTFKMVTAVAGLELGVIAPISTIRCGALFTRAGRPYARCIFSRGSSINVTQAIATSCNYFFFETAMRMGNTPAQRIENLNRYMEFFGFNQRTGVEIGELADEFNRERTPDIMASPSLKNFLHISRNPFAPAGQRGWFDGDTIRTAIGQSYNNYSAAMMARYFTQIANSGVRLPLHLVGTIESYCDGVIYRTMPTPYNTGIEVSASTWEAVQNGMLQATMGVGTAASQFRGFPIPVAGKTGTAEQVGSRPSHTSFGGYAPFDNPQIAIYVNIPFGAVRAMPSASTLIARDVIRVFLVPEVDIQQPVPYNTLVR